MTKSNLLKLGTLVNTHGLKGAVRIMSDYDYTEEFAIGNEVTIKDKKYKIASVRKHKSFTLLTFEGITDINNIEFLKGNDVFGEKTSSSTHIPEFVGLEVIMEGKKVGEVVDYFPQGKIFSLLVQLDDGRLTNIPMIEGEFVESYNDTQIHILNKQLF